MSLHKAFQTVGSGLRFEPRTPTQRQTAVRLSSKLPYSFHNSIRRKCLTVLNLSTESLQLGLESGYCLTLFVEHDAVNRIRNKQSTVYKKQKPRLRDFYVKKNFYKILLVSTYISIAFHNFYKSFQQKRARIEQNSTNALKQDTKCPCTVKFL